MSSEDLVGFEPEVNAKIDLKRQWNLLMRRFASHFAKAALMNTQ